MGSSVSLVQNLCISSLRTISCNLPRNTANHFNVWGIWGKRIIYKL